ncbi:MAG: DUF4249 domain-containing protein [Prevotellaceae bacterium]|nr:DUF4249 domain-containing protein [Prevotellaceae bacterium]
MLLQDYFVPRNNEASLKGIIPFIFPLFLVAITLFSCEKVIDPDLKEAETRLVIEAVITDVPDSACVVRISQTTPFTSTGKFIGISNATVQLSDGELPPVSLNMTEPGVYTTTDIKGTPGHLYYLSVQHDGKTYTATSQMPDPVPLDTLYQSTEHLIGETFFMLKGTYTDPAERENFYRTKTSLNGDFGRGISVSSDEDYNGIERPINIMLRRETIVGDTVDFYFFCIDKSSYTYFYSLRQMMDSNAASPANPQSNIAGGCLGYFSAHTVESKRIIIQ